MAEKIARGTVLIEGNARMPASLRFDSELYSNGWRLVKYLDVDRLGRRIADQGWSFLYIAATINVIVFGFDRQKALRRAVKRILATVKSQRFNGAEMTHVSVKRFLGIPYVTISAHARHIQQSLYLAR